MQARAAKQRIESPVIPMTLPTLLALTAGLLQPADLRLELSASPLASPQAAPLWQSIADPDHSGGSLTLEPATPYVWLFAPGEAARLTASVAAGEADDAGLLTAWDWANRPVAELALPVGTTSEVAVEASLRGVWLLTLDRIRGGAPVERLARSLGFLDDQSAAQAAWRAGEFQPGTCAFPGRQHWSNAYGLAAPPGLTEEQSRSLDAELHRRLGLTLVRPDLAFEWAGEDAPIDFARCDAALAAWTSRGFRLDLQVSLPGDWAVLEAYREVPDPLWRYPKREAPSRRLARETVARYGAAAEFLELWNEPDNRDFWRGTPEEYVAWARWASEEARQASPTAVLGGGGLCLIEPVWSGIYARELAGSLDLVTYHSHGGCLELESALGAMRAIHAAAGLEAPAFANTEMGHAAWRLDMERAQAATTLQKLLTCWAEGHRAALVYCSRDVGGPRQRLGEPDWGALDYTFCPRFVYGQLSAFSEGLAGARFVERLAKRQNLRVLRFARGEETIVALFTPYDAEQVVTLHSDARAARVVDPMGNATPQPDPTRIEIHAGYQPQLVALTGASEVGVE